MKKRVLSMLMALALCLTLLPAPAWAAEADAPESGAIVQEEQQEKAPAEETDAPKDGETTAEAVAKVTTTAPNGVAESKQEMQAQDNNGKSYLNLAEAFAGVADGGTVTMLKSLTGDNMISFCKDTNKKPVDKTVTLMMKGNSLSFAGAPTLYVESGKLIIGDEATISQTEKTKQPAVLVNNEEKDADRGTLEFQGKATLTGGLLI